MGIVATAEGSLVIECPDVHILGRIFLQIGRMHHQSYSESLRFFFTFRTLTSILSDFSIHSSSPLTQTLNSRARIEGSKTFNLTLVGVAMLRAQHMIDTLQIMSTNLRYVETSHECLLSQLLNNIQINLCS